MDILLLTEPGKAAFMNLPHAVRIDRPDEPLAHQMGGIKRRKYAGCGYRFRHGEVVKTGYWMAVIWEKKER